MASRALYLEKNERDWSPFPSRTPAPLGNQNQLSTAQIPIQASEARMPNGRRRQFDLTSCLAGSDTACRPGAARPLYLESEV